MVTNENIRAQLPHVLLETSLDFLGEKYQGKVRDNYTHGDRRFLITSDRLSCFDVVVTSVPFKGQALNQMAVQWFNKSSSIISNHIIDVPDPNVIVAKNCEILPIELVVRGYLAGSAWRDYEAGKDISGVRLPTGLKMSSQLPEVIITPSTKAPKGSHDMPISESEILSQRLVEPAIWQQAKEAAMALFSMGTAHAKKQGLILVDTKYEFGLHQGKLILADEIHTMDSSRYWIADTYSALLAEGQSPQMLDKEPTRQWLLSQGFKGDGAIPHFTDDHRIEISKHYIAAYERILGEEFTGEVGSVSERIESNLRRYISKV
jgi:phosphoribosylaminoimidazole-succinocarboxamide synthase